MENIAAVEQFVCVVFSIRVPPPCRWENLKNDVLEFFVKVTSVYQLFSLFCTSTYDISMTTTMIWQEFLFLFFSFS